MPTSEQTAVEARIKARDGVMLLFAYRGVLLEDDTGRRVVCVVGRAIREYQEAECARDRSEEALLEALPDLPFSPSREGEHLLASGHGRKRKARN